MNAKDYSQSLTTAESRWTHFYTLMADDSLYRIDFVVVNEWQSLHFFFLLLAFTANFEMIWPKYDTVFEMKFLNMFFLQRSDGMLNWNAFNHSSPVLTSSFTEVSYNISIVQLATN